MSLRDAKEVVVDVDQMYGSLAPSERAYIIRADRAAVIAEAKDVVRQFATIEQPTQQILAALDALLAEKE